MGNSNAKRNYHSHQKYASQYSLSDLLGGSCVTTTQTSNEGGRSWSRASHKSWTAGTVQDTHGSSKTVWPVPRFQSMFLPEFPIKEIPLKTGYIFLNVIARGAYGKVYKVQKQDNGQVFALKVISKAMIVAENAVIQAKQEVAIQRMVGHHPFIVNSTHRWQGRKTLYILTDYIPGGELYSLVEEYGCLPENVVRIYVAEVALAIDFLHNAGITHRDIKATNILLDKDGHAVIIDFGFAKWLQHTERTNTLCGTPEYMAPEILRKEYYGQEVDWWSLGVLVCFLLTNQYPSTVSSELSPDHDEPNDLDRRPPGTLPADANISAAARDLLKRLLQPEPRLRLRTLLSLQRIAFYMGHDLQSYMLKKESPFQLLGVTSQREAQRQRVKDSFPDFESFPDGDIVRPSDQ
ncbi:PREDICTED: serine/threonine-protein kinase S6KL isoform X1 [Dinoponera quadriceps]|uniref:Serine/threonine-protein kinase S6KL isoform X1 n=1 Tax=Dinoponera quadriceps TaxID=609295 RepID=A0A6P3Y031_DINQU|nr:PREDICTED: serine/threonine-protein kinase S6KL isoform X1 [Dinoponera quadriceps]XP_014484140.1 PREDICTED: serine/threonine-protein kinase S6KL isoform X1 [Dinoponera quadriceps]XP_014484141.1 PREDICTED: serine/threonine-protein kinase S6KL isoform X1 [Dinoponera quadriceps]XP_014484142.1 PREDICTED: serine/threonine-protein kinase S6KL isoform X1 [Dinoponera quadriceps]